MLNDFSKNIGEWKDGWIQFDADHHGLIPGYTGTWEIFRMAISSIDIFTENTFNTVEQLKNIRHSIPKLEENQKLEVKIKEARAGINNLAKKIAQLEQDKKEIERQIAGGRQNPLKSFANCITPQTPSDNLIERQSSVEIKIKSKKATLRQKITRFERNKTTLYEESKVEEIERCKLLKKQATAFLKAFDVTSEDFKQVSTEYDAKNDLNHWETTSVRKKQSANPVSIKQRKVSADEDNDK